MSRENIYYSLNPQGGQPSPNPNIVPEGLESEIVDGRSRRITRYTGNAATLNIPAQIQGLPVTAIVYGAFSNCTSLTSVTIPSSVISIDIDASNLLFSGCINLTNITVDSRNPVYASIDGVLFDKNIQTVIKYPAGKTVSTYTIPSSVTTIMSNAFVGSRSLTSINISQSVTHISYFALSACTSLTSITVDNRNPVYTSIDGVLFDKNMRTIIAYPAGKTARTYTIPSSITSIEVCAFYYCSNLTSITIPSSVTVISFGAFWGCSNLTSVTIPSSVTNIENSAFYDCSNLTSVTLSRRTQRGENAFPASARITYSD
jgi:hypothetical protein